MVRKRNVRMLALAGWAAWACALPENNPPVPADGGPEGGTGNGGTSTGGKGGGTTGGAMTGGATTGGATTGGAMTGGATTGGATTGGSGGSTGGSMAGTSTGGTMAGAGGKGGTAGTGGTTGGAGMAGKGGTAGSAAGTGGTTGGAGMAGKGGAGMSGTGGTAPTVCPCLVHRYSFTGSGTTATDSIGTAHGTITGGTQSGGVVALSGTEQYVTLPTGLIGGLTAATFEAWVTWSGGTANWHRIFDFGSNAGDSGDQGTVAGNAAAPYIFLTPRAGASTGSANCMMPTTGMPRVAVTGAGPSMESCVFGAAAFPTAMTHVAVTVSATMNLYVNGAPVGTPIAPAVSLASITETHNWLGRSQYAPDGEFAGTISEFRIYNTARSAAQISASRTAGEDSPPAQ